MTARHALPAWRSWPHRVAVWLGLAVDLPPWRPAEPTTDEQDPHTVHPDDDVQLLQTYAQEYFSFPKPCILGVKYVSDIHEPKALS